MVDISCKQLHGRLTIVVMKFFLPAVKDLVVEVFSISLRFSSQAEATVAGVFLLWVFLTVGEAVGLGHGLWDGDWEGVVPFR